MRERTHVLVLASAAVAAGLALFYYKVTNLGLPLTPSMNAVITCKLPKVTAHEAIMTGQRYDAGEAQIAGIVNLTAAEDDVLAGREPHEQLELLERARQAEARALDR